jgi:hypothetical protein
MPNEDKDEPQVLRAAIRLGMPSRWAALILGLVSMATGAAAAFRAHLEAPPVALLTVGMILALVGLAGVMPTRLKVGDNEAEFYQEQQRRVAAVLREEYESAPAEERATVQEIVDRVAEVAPQVAEPARSSSQYDRTVRRMLDELTEGTPGTLIQEGRLQGAGFAAFDAAINVPSRTGDSRQRHLLVKIKGSRIGISAINELMDQANWYAKNHVEDETTLLLVTRYAPGAFHAGLVSGDGGYHQVTVRGPEDKDRLATALREALAGPPIRISA